VRAAQLRNDKNVQHRPIAWFGSLLQGKMDETGQLFMRARYYDPVTGRFTQEDPLGLAGGVNEYGFAAGDLVNYGDPFGLWFTPFNFNLDVYFYRAAEEQLAQAQLRDARTVSSDMGSASSLPKGYPAVGEHITIINEKDAARFYNDDGTHPDRVKFTFEEPVIRYETTPERWMEPITDLGHPTLNVRKVGPNVQGIEDGEPGYIEWSGRMKVWNAAFTVDVRIGTLGAPVVWVTGGPYLPIRP
jgi:RHS repeat-associated protein